MMNLDLAGRRAVVTGASLGIGAATVRLFADHGAAVTFCARNESAIAELAGYRPQHGSGSVTGLPADMNEADSVNAFLDQVESAGTTDILINNVGASPSRNFLYMSDDDWHELIQLNLMSAVRCTRRLLPAMRKQRWGRVVMVASAAAKYPGAALIDYGATKAALVATGKALSKKYGADNVLVNSAGARGSTMEDVLAGNAKSVPVGRYGRSEEVAAVIVFLCTDAASFVSGAAIDVDGGQGAHV